jgi:toxin ParE1/3/4
MSDYDLSSLARLDLRKIWVFTAEKWGRRKADSYLQEIRATIGIAASDFRVGVQIDPLDPDLRRAFIGSHAIFYRVVGEQVRVIRVLHQAMDAGSLLN